MVRGNANWNDRQDTGYYNTTWILLSTRIWRKEYCQGRDPALCCQCVLLVLMHCPIVVVDGWHQSQEPICYVHYLVPQSMHANFLFQRLLSTVLVGSLVVQINCWIGLQALAFVTILLEFDMFQIKHVPRKMTSHTSGWNKHLDLVLSSMQLNHKSYCCCKLHFCLNVISLWCIFSVLGSNVTTSSGVTSLTTFLSSVVVALLFSESNSFSVA